MTLILRAFRGISTLVFFGAILSGLLALGGFGLFLVAVKDLPQVPDPIGRINDTPATEIFSADGRRILTIGGRETVALEDVSYAFIQAILATEDHRFGTITASTSCARSRRCGSRCLNPEGFRGPRPLPSNWPKICFSASNRPICVSSGNFWWPCRSRRNSANRKYWKRISIRFPSASVAYGVGQAARTFFGKSAGELNLAEASLLAGLPKSPTRYNPFRYPERAQARQAVVLKRMVDTGMISAQEVGEAIGAPLNLRTSARALRVDSYFLDMVMKSLEDTYGPEVVYHGGLRVFTTLDVSLQQQAEASLQEGLVKLESQMKSNHQPSNAAAQTDNDNGLQGALVTVDVNTGAVKALVGGRDYFQTPYNRALQNNRQPGSGFKPFLYFSAFENLNKSPADIVVDKPVTIAVAGKPPWKPRNFERAYNGPMVIKKAFIESVNTVAAQLVEALGPERVIQTARRCGIASPLNPVYSVALGTSGVSPLEMAAAYATFASGGVRHTPFWILRVEDVNGQVLEEHIITGERVLNESITYQLVDMMAGVIEEGTGKVVRSSGFSMPAAGKTGTTNGYHDAWFTGFTPNLSTSVWVGFDRGQGMRNRWGAGITGGRGAAPIWADYMKKATQGEPPRAFAVPGDIYFRKVNPENGSRAGFWTDDPISVALRKGQS